MGFLKGAQSQGLGRRHLRVPGFHKPENIWVRVKARKELGHPLHTRFVSISTSAALGLCGKRQTLEKGNSGDRKAEAHATPYASLPSPSQVTSIWSSDLGASVHFVTPYQQCDLEQESTS